jgi:chromate transport protein ChrA
MSSWIVVAALVLVPLVLSWWVGRSPKLWRKVLVSGVLLALTLAIAGYAFLFYRLRAEPVVYYLAISLAVYTFVVMLASCWRFFVRSTKGRT